MEFSSIISNQRSKKLFALSIIFFLIMLFAFLFTGYTVTHHQQLKFDSNIFTWLHSIQSISVTRLMSAITFFGSRYFLFPCYTVLVIYYVFIRKKLWFAVAVALIGLVGNEMLFLMQDLFKRVRPQDQLIKYVDGYGYPSGHSFASFVFAGLLCFLVWKKLAQTKWKVIVAIVLFFMASIIALSRVYLHVHYPTDVLGGFYLAMLWLIPCLWTLYFIDQKYY